MPYAQQDIATPMAAGTDNIPTGSGTALQRISDAGWHAGETGDRSCGGKLDADTVCAYQTPKVVIIRSWKLGVLSNVIKVVVVAYMIFQIFDKQGYLRLESVYDSGLSATIYSHMLGRTTPDYCCECNPGTGLPNKPYDPEKGNPYDVGYHSCEAMNGKPGACCTVSDKVSHTILQ